AMFLVFFLINTKTHNSTGITADKQQVVAVNKAMVTNQVVVTNMTNAIQKIVLSDGSKVWLSPNSKLTYSKLFGNHTRQVSMTGEAFFEVTKDAKKPFSIYSENV